MRFLLVRTQTFPFCIWANSNAKEEGIRETNYILTILGDVHVFTCRVEFKDTLNVSLVVFESIHVV